MIRLRGNRKVIFLFSLLMSFANATNYNEVIGGSLTYHIFDPNDQGLNYSNRVDSTGALIQNPLLGYRQVHQSGSEYTSQTVFTGQNSIGQPMFGMAYSSGFTTGTFRFGTVAGFYFQDADAMLKRNVTPIYIIPHPGWCPSPVLGLEFIKTVEFSNDRYLILNGLVTPILLNATVGIGWRL